MLVSPVGDGPKYPCIVMSLIPTISLLELCVILNSTTVPREL